MGLILIVLAIAFLAARTMEYVSAACIASALIIIVIVLYFVFRGKETTSFQDRPAINPTTRSWIHLPDHDQPFPMLTPVDKEGHQGQKYYREKYRRLKLNLTPPPLPADDQEGR